MNKMTKLAAAIALASGALATAPAMAEVEMSANAGFVTDYYFRGFNLGDAGAYAGFDIASGGFYAGTWVISDNGEQDSGLTEAGDDGLETDFYVGWGTEFENGVWIDVAYNRYEYTYKSDYEDEVMLTGGIGAFSFEYTDGQWHDETSPSADKDDGDYTFMAISWSGDVFSATYGVYEDESDSDYEYEHDYFEVSASGEVAGLDVTATAGKTFNAKGEDAGVDDDLIKSGDGYLFLDISKSFDL